MTNLARLLLTLTLLTTTAVSDVQAALITFDDRPTGLTMQDTYEAEGIRFFTANSSFQPGTVDGVTGQFLIQANDRAVSPPNLALGSDGRPLSSRFFRDFVGEFYLPGKLLPATTNSVSFWVVATMPGQTTAPWTAVIFGRRNNFFDDVNNQRLEVITGTSDTAFVSFSHPLPDIAGFLLLASDNREAIDDLSFATPTVPEPSTLALAGTLLVACGLAKVVAREKQKTQT